MLDFKSGILCFSVDCDFVENMNCKIEHKIWFFVHIYALLYYSIINIMMIYEFFIFIMSKKYYEDWIYFENNFNQKYLFWNYICNLQSVVISHRKLEENNEIN